jgi:hypothetical protein
MQVDHLLVVDVVRLSTRMPSVVGEAGLVLQAALIVLHDLAVLVDPVDRVALDRRVLLDEHSADEQADARQRR